MRLQLLLIIPQIMYTIAQLSVQSHQYQKLMDVYFAYLQRHHYKGINNQMFEPFQFHFVNEGNAGAVYAFKDSSFPDGLAIKVSYYMMGEVSNSELVGYFYVSTFDDYPSYVLKPYLGIKCYYLNHGSDTEMEMNRNKVSVHVHEFDNGGYDIVKKMNLNIFNEKVQQYLVDNYGVGTVQYLAMPQGTPFENEFHEKIVSLGFYAAEANHLHAFIDKYEVYPIDYKINNMLMVNGQRKWIDFDTLCRGDEPKKLNDDQIQIWSYILPCNRIQFHEFNLNAPEMNVPDWDLDAQSTLSFNIGIVLLTDLLENHYALLDRHYGRSEWSDQFRPKIPRNYSQLLKLIQSMTDPSWIQHTKADTAIQQLILYKQELLRKILPLPKEEELLYFFENDRIPGIWHPTNRITLQEIETEADILHQRWYDSYNNYYRMNRENIIMN